MSVYYLNVTIHVLTALFWLGGMFFLAVVGAPVLSGVERCSAPDSVSGRRNGGLSGAFATS